jgi:Domain of unknown function (DUF6531)
MLQVNHRHVKGLAVPQAGGFFVTFLLSLLPICGAHAAIPSTQCEQNSGADYCEAKPRLWGGDAWGGPSIYPSFGDAVGALMPFVMEFTGPSAYPAGFPRQQGLPYPNACFSCSHYTHQISFNSGEIIAEQPYISPPSTYKYAHNGTPVGAVPKCRGGLTDTTGNINFCSRTGRDPDKDVGPCPDCRDPGLTAFPTQAGTGNKYQTQTDYAGSGPAPLEFRRYYNSQIRFNASLGARWRSSYDRQIVVMDTSGGAPSVTARRHTGSSLVFTYWGGAWRSSKDVSDQLSQLVDGGGNPVGWQYYASGPEETETYDVAGRLIAIASRSGLTRTRGTATTLNFQVIH